MSATTWFLLYSIAEVHYIWRIQREPIASQLFKNPAMTWNCRSRVAIFIVHMQAVSGDSSWTKEQRQMILTAALLLPIKDVQVPWKKSSQSLSSHVLNSLKWSNKEKDNIKSILTASVHLHEAAREIKVRLGPILWLSTVKILSAFLKQVLQWLHCHALQRKLERSPPSGPDSVS